MFAPEYGIAENPATGSSTGPLASFMMKQFLHLQPEHLRAKDPVARLSAADRRAQSPK
jgi:predicted PhzF superfamily epimerase YddE/YHI9